MYSRQLLSLNTSVAVISARVDRAAYASPVHGDELPSGRHNMLPLRAMKLFVTLGVGILPLLILAGCAKQGEGERCDQALSGDSDCESGLECVKADMLRVAVDTCCPAQGESNSDSRCDRFTDPGDIAGSGGTDGAAGSSGMAGSAGTAATAGSAAGSAGSSATQGSGGASADGPECRYDSECDGDLVCGPTGTCQPECLGNKDCTAPNVCDTATQRCIDPTAAN